MRYFKIQSSNRISGDQEEGESVGWILYYLVFDILQLVLAYSYLDIPRWGNMGPSSGPTGGGGRGRSGHRSAQGIRDEGKVRSHEGKKTSGSLLLKFKILKWLKY